MRNILVIDDEGEVAESIASLLQLRGYLTHVALDGVRALELAEQHAIGLVLLDWHLDDGPSGEALVQKLRERCGPIPVVVVSADAATLAAAARADVSDYLPKPFVAAELLRLVDEY